MASLSQLAQERGEKLFLLIEEDLDSNTISSPFTAFSDLHLHAWYQSGPNREFATLAEFDFEEFFTHGIHQDRKDVESIDWTHMANGIARYCALYNVQDGSVFLTDTVSPRGALRGANDYLFKQKPPVQPLPALQHWSDVMYLQWMELCRIRGKNPKELKRVTICNISNTATVGVIREIYISGDQNYPGRMFKPGESDFLALLDTANAQGLAYLLAQHKAESQLGKKTIDSVQVFKGGATKRWYLVFLLSL